MTERLAPTSPSALEARRLAALRGYGILDTPRETVFDDFTRIAATICGTPIAVVNLIDEARQWFKAEIGLGTRETPLDTSICAHAILQHDLFVVPDTREDTRFANNPLVTGNPNLRFYAGALLKTGDGLALGTMCVLDLKPRLLDDSQIGVLEALARQVMAQLELRRALRDATRSSHYRAGLLASAGHDLKAPMRQALYGISRVLPDVAAPQQERLETVTSSLQQIDRSFDTLVAAGGGRDTYTVTRLEPVPLAALLETAVAPFRALAARKDLRLDIAPTALVGLSHATLLGTLVGNLVGNAVKYTERGRVLVGCRRRGDEVLVEVHDTGVGMPADDIEQLFDAFHQSDRKVEGIGLGLWIVRQAAETLGHTVDARSTPGAGTRMRVVLPRWGAPSDVSDNGAG